MNIYIAARYSRKEEMKKVRDVLQKAEFAVTSSWLDEPHGANTQLNELSDSLNEEYAQVDIDDINRADRILFFSESVLTPRGGRHVEFGYALAQGKSIDVVGPKENIFHYLPGVYNYPTFIDYLYNLKIGVEDLI